MHPSQSEPKPTFVADSLAAGVSIGGGLAFVATAISPQAFGWLVFRGPRKIC
jgi:enterochelin esterase-like enzyme